MNSSTSIRPLALVTLGWLAAVVLVGATSVAAHARPLVPLMILGPVAAWIVAYRRSSTWRARIDALPLRWLIGLHAARAPIGVGLLLAHQRGMLPAAFAIKAGSMPRWCARRYLFVVEREPLLTAGAPHLPFILLPGFIVPLVIATHVAIAARLRRAAAPAPQRLPSLTSR